MLRKLSSKLHYPRVTFSRIGQIIFTFKEVAKLAAQISPKLLVLVLLLNAFWGILAFPGFYIEKLIIDTLIQNIGNPSWQAAGTTIALLLAGRIFLELVSKVVGSISRFLRYVFSRRMSAHIETLIGKKFTELDLAAIEDPEFRDKFNAIERQYNRPWALMQPLSDIPNYAFGFLSGMGILFLLHPLVTVGVFIFLLPQFFIDSKYIKKDYELHKSLAPLRRIWGWLTYYLYKNRNFAELKILNLSPYLAKQLEQIQRKSIDPEIELEKEQQISSLGSTVLFSLFELGVSIWTAFLALSAKITIGTMELYLRTLRSSSANLSGLVASFLEMYQNYIYVVDLLWFLNFKPKIVSPENGIHHSTEELKIKVSNILFRYKDDQPWILKDISFEAKAGQRIAIVGENGAGKSTLIKLLARFYDPQKGEILVNDVALPKYNLYQWRENLAVLFQDFEGYPFSVRESIGFGDIARINSLDEIKLAAKQTRVDKFIEDLPKKYENPLEPEFEGGVRPSAGQWQRIGISRMLFRKRAKILILDEPTSNVDPEAEEEIFNELSKIAKDKILIFVTQRFSTVRHADTILVINKGKIVEQGTHKQLMKKKGKYAKLFTLQAKGYQIKN